MLDPLPLLGGAYQARSVIANAQRCINLFPEINPKDAPVPVTHYQRPGLMPLAQGIVAPVRGIYRASNGNGYCAIGSNIYSITPTFSLRMIGQIGTQFGTQVFMIDNGTDLILVDGSHTGYKINLGTNAFAAISDPSGTFTGAARVEVIDGFILWGPTLPNNNQWGSTQYGTPITFNSLYTAGKQAYPDPLVSIAVNNHEIFLLGALKSEIWYNAGQVDFPFLILPGPYIEHGCVAAASVATSDIGVYWLGQDLQGEGVVFRQRSYQTSRISNHALEVQVRRMAKRNGITDAIGYTYQQDGHTFYVLSFPAGDQTWAFDEATQEWHQRCWVDSSGVLHRDRTNCHAFLYGKNVVGDWQNGTIYSMDLDTYSDTIAVGTTPSPLVCVRTFPHVTSGRFSDGTQKKIGWAELVQHNRFIADLETGTGPVDVNGNPAQVSLRWSADRGKTWGNRIYMSAGKPGEYSTQCQFNNQGLSRDIVYELEYSIAGPAALNGAWIEPTITVR